ncbi:MAG: hypothetical protein RLZ63_187 [Pseudomonadota bacterium]
MTSTSSAPTAPRKNARTTSAPSTAKKATPSVKKAVVKKAAAPKKAPTPKTPPQVMKTEAAKAPAKPEKMTAGKERKVKVVRDSYTIPKLEYAQLGELKKRALTMGVAVKKSELLRAGLLLLSKQGDTQLKSSLAQVPAIKTGRPAKS